MYFEDKAERTLKHIVMGPKAHADLQGTMDNVQDDGSL